MKMDAIQGQMDYFTASLTEMQQAFAAIDGIN
jgi:hypothetical protein